MVSLAQQSSSSQGDWKNKFFRPSINHPSKKVNRHWNDLIFLPNWQKLSKSDQRFIKMSYPQRYCRKSFAELSDLFNIPTRKNTIKQVQVYIDKGWLIKEERFFKHCKTGENLGKHAPNYYYNSKEGKQHLQELLDFLFEGQEIQKSFTGVPSNRLSKLSKNMPRESADSITSCEKKKEGVIISDDLEAMYEALLATKKHPIRNSTKTIFEVFSQEQNLDRIYPHILEDIDKKHTTLEIRNALQWMKNKKEKGLRIRNFWGLFRWRLRMKKNPTPWRKMVAQAYLDAVDGKQTEGAKKIQEGVDTAQIAASIAKIQKESGEKVSLKAMEGLLARGSHALKQALDWVMYRRKIKQGMDKWIGLAIWVTKKDVNQILSLYQKMKKPADEVKQESFEEGWAKFDGSELTKQAVLA